MGAGQSQSPGARRRRSAPIWVVAGFIACLGPAAAAFAEDPDHAQVVTGTVEDIDREQLKVKLKTDLDKNVFIEVVQPDLLREVQTGDRLTARLNDQGKADKVTKLAVPELSPADAPPGRTER